MKIGDRLLPATWVNFTPAQKIAWFNANEVKPSELRAAGVPESDITFMRANGYTQSDFSLTPLLLAVGAYYFFGM